MDDRSFFDVLYQGWAKTTGAENTFWMPEENTDEDETNRANYAWDLFAVGQDQKRTFLGGFKNEADAAFVTALHGCFGDLVKRLHDALDEAERLDERADEQESTIAGLAIEIQDLERELGR